MDTHDIFLVFVEGRDGHQHAYAEWFAGTHMIDMERLPGVVSASAFHLESLDGQPLPAQLCAIYETADGPGILTTIAGAKGTDALPTSDIQGAMTWRVLEGVRSCPIAATGEAATELICLFGGPWDEAAEDRLWQALCDDAPGVVAIRQTRLSPVQPSRGSEYGSVMFVTLDPSAEPSALAQAIGETRAAPDARFFLARPLCG